MEKIRLGSKADFLLQKKLWKKYDITELEFTDYKEPLKYPCVMVFTCVNLRLQISFVYKTDF